MQKEKKKEKENRFSRMIRTTLSLNTLPIYRYVQNHRASSTLLIRMYHEAKSDAWLSSGSRS